MNRLKQGMIGAVLLALAAVVAVPAFADGNFGPDTCLNGYVWREATSSDHVCVTAGVREQIRADNASASSRRSPNGGPFGRDTCRQGYVWREATPTDHVCVTPSTRSQAAADNRAAANRRASVNLWLRRYSSDTTTCNNGSCTRASDDAARYRANADHINVGRSRLFLRRLDGTRITSWTINATANPSAPGGRISFRTGRLAICRGSNNAYFQLQDLASGRLSQKRYIRTGCATL
jgi:hypothetical protein